MECLFHPIFWLYQGYGTRILAIIQAPTVRTFSPEGVSTHFSEPYLTAAVVRHQSAQESRGAAINISGKTEEHALAAQLPI